MIYKSCGKNEKNQQFLILFFVKRNYEIEIEDINLRCNMKVIT